MGLFSGKRQIPPTPKFNYSNVEVEPCGLSSAYPTYNDGYLKYGANMKYVHVVKLKHDYGEYKAGSKFTKDFDSVVFKHISKDGKIICEAETLVIDLRTWKRV